MATREENIKKINEELEKLDDEQLEQIAGGGWRPSWQPVHPKQENQEKPDKSNGPVASWW